MDDEAENVTSLITFLTRRSQNIGMRSSKATSAWVLAFLLLFAATSAVSPAQHTFSPSQRSGGATKSNVGKRMPAQRNGAKRFVEDLLAVTEPNARLGSPLTETRTTFTSVHQFVDGANAPASSRAPPAGL